MYYFLLITNYLHQRIKKKKLGKEEGKEKGGKGACLGFAHPKGLSGPHLLLLLPHLISYTAPARLPKFYLQN